MLLGLTATQYQFKDSFVAHTQNMREFYFSVDLLNLAPALIAPALLTILAGGFWLWRKRIGPDMWILGCLCLPVFPRLATYSYILAFPFVLLLFRELKPFKAFLASCVVIGPLPWILRESAWLPGERLENWALFVWSIVAMIGFYVYLWRADVTQPRPS